MHRLWEAVEIYRSPSADGYAHVVRASREGTVSPLAFADVVLPAAEIFA